MRAAGIGPIVAVDYFRYRGTPSTMLIAPLLLAAGLSLPVQVASCAVVEGPTSIPGSYFGPLVPNTGSLNISFVNRDAKPIMSVAFTVSDRNSTVAVVDKGTFSTGVLINHILPAPAITTNDVSCIVSSVAFADGSTWQGTEIGGHR